MNYSYNVFGGFPRSAMTAAISSALNGKRPVVCCIGTDAVIGDSLGPLCGTMLSERLAGKTYIYGTVEKPIVAKDVAALAGFISGAHKGCEVLAVDAALGDKDELGTVKITDRPIKPGLGVNKNLSFLGTASIIAIVAEKNALNSFSSVRLSLVYPVAKAISDAIYDYFVGLDENSSFAVGSGSKDAEILNNRQILLKNA